MGEKECILWTASKGCHTSLLQQSRVPQACSHKLSHISAFAQQNSRQQNSTNIPPEQHTRANRTVHTNICPTDRFAAVAKHLAKRSASLPAEPSEPSEPAVRSCERCCWQTRVQRQPTRVPDPGHGGGHPTRAWHFHQPHLLDVPTNHGCYPREHCTSTNDNSVRRGWGRCGKRGSVLHVMSNGPPTRRRISTGPPRALAFQYWTIGRKLATVNSIWEPDRSRCIGEVAATQRPGTGIHPQ